MYSLWNRLNAVFFYAVTVLLAMALGSAVTTLWMTPQPVVHKLALNNLSKFDFMRERLKNGRFLSVDRSVVTFDLDADLSGVFNWNVKQLFVYISVTYETEKKSKNEVVIWDHIIQNKSDAHVVRLDTFAKYPLISQGTDLRARPISLTLHWDVMPITGILYLDGKGSTTVQLPPEYCPDGCAATVLAAA